MGRPKTVESVTFICDAIGCSNEKTMKENMFARSDNHYCSYKCYYSTRRTVVFSLKDVCKKCKSPMAEFDKYALTGSFSSYCKACRYKKYELKLLERGLRQREFVKRFNSL
jgi:hypothetical protein